MAKTLYCEGAGCEGNNVNDVDNCRIRTAFRTADGREFYLELLSGCENYRRHEAPPGGTKKKWNHDYYVTFPNMIIVDFCFELHNGNGDCNANRHPIERKMTGLAYTKANILKLVNDNLGCSFDDVIVLPWLSGYRVHSGNPKRKYNLMDDFTDIPARTLPRSCPGLF